MGVITVSRQIGSLGEDVSSALAERLGYQYVDRAALTRAAQTYGGIESTTPVPEIEEKKPTFFERLQEERHRYRALLRSLMLDFAEQDNVVLLGMGGAYLLKEYSHVLSVLTVSNRAARMDRLARLGTPESPVPMDREAAAEAIRTSDRERSGYVRYLFNVDWMDPSCYDLVVNTSRFSVSEVADMLAAAAEQANLRLTPQSADELHLSALAGRVEATLLSNAGIWVHGLKVIAEGSVVYLSGEVITEEDRDIAEQATLQVRGVTRVVNDLRIQPPPMTGM